MLFYEFSKRNAAGASEGATAVHSFLALIASCRILSSTRLETIGLTIYIPTPGRILCFPFALPEIIKRAFPRHVTKSGRIKAQVAVLAQTGNPSFLSRTSSA